MIKKTIGGDRLGSGNKMKAALHNYERSTHDLGNVWRSSMTCGTLVPFYKKLCTNGDTWSINLKTLVKTLPAIGPCFGSYKLQLDVFEVPIRLYNGILHNNMTKIGMDMAKVKIPKIELTAKWQAGTTQALNKTAQIASDSLMCYMGVRGVGSATEETQINREFNAIPILAYYDIFKNYYANKQEENAYIIDNEVDTNTSGSMESIQPYKTENGVIDIGLRELSLYQDGQVEYSGQYWNVAKWNTKPTEQFKVTTNNAFKIKWNGNIDSDILMIYDSATLTNGELVWDNTDIYISLTQQTTIQPIGLVDIYKNNWWENGVISIPSALAVKGMLINPERSYLKGILYIPKTTTTSRSIIKPFKLENIDTMRINILRETALNHKFMLNDQNLEPYNTIWETKADQQSGSAQTMCGLCLKTYQSDIMNCWVSSNWIDGIKGVNEISAIAVEEGKIYIDAINLKKKVYNMLNRIAVSGGTYEDWQEAVYGEDALRRAESPIYSGGMSGIIAFEEVVSTADTNTNTAGDQPLGSLAGKGTLTNIKGGDIEIHIKEPSYIIGIVSITPYVDYSNGNDFDMTELESINDLHKPELDEIGFQDLMLEKAAWWAVQYNADADEWTKPAGGKQPAWLDYMTSINQVYGDFANINKCGWMVLNRDYEIGRAKVDNATLDNSDALRYSMIKDWTTYINPTKYNYQFANNSLEAQNFWVQIGINAICRRKISAKLIPNL